MLRNLFTRRERQAQPEPAVVVPEAVKADFEERMVQYISFCKGSVPFRQLEHDFRQLVTHPRIAALAFDKHAQVPTLLVGTKLVTIRDPETQLLHEIGEFLITIQRSPNKVRYINITQRMKHVDKTRVSNFHHPHVYDSGEMCMNVGQDVMFEHLGKGLVYDAVRYMLAGLWKVDEGQIGAARIEHWPLVKE